MISVQNVALDAFRERFSPSFVARLIIAPERELNALLTLSSQFSFVVRVSE